MSGYQAIGTIDPNNSVIFLGSGFSLESTNLKEAHPPNGAGLRKHFIEELDLPADTTYDLQILTDEFAEKDADRLTRELYNIFRVSSAGPNQETIFAQNWLRIYTTNYDDTVEICHHKRGVQPRSFDAQAEIPNKLPKNSIIHLHGSIRAVTPENVRSSLVLGESSYVRQYLAKSPWYNQFQVDLRFASQIFIVGYSMADYHISALLLENPGLAKKTFFIQGTDPDATFVRRTKSFGQALFIGLEGLVDAVTKLPRPEPISDIAKLTSFRALDPQRDKKGLKPPTVNEIFDLFVFGSFNYARCVSTLPKQTYVISRQKEVDKLLAELANYRSIIIDSRLGNGKTIFLYLVFIALAELGYNCFLFKDVGPEIDAEISLLKTVPRVILLFDQYTISQDILKRLAGDLPDAKFIVEIRTSIFEVRYHEIRESVAKPFSRVNLNYLSKDDISAFKALCERAGLASSRAATTFASAEMRDMLLELFESEHIKSKITAALAPIFDGQSRRKVLLLTTLLSSFSLSTDPSFIKTVTGVDPYSEFIGIKEISDEVFEIGLDVFKIRSSIFSEYAVLNFLSPSEILDCVVEAAFASAARKSERRYRVLMSNLMQYSNLHLMLRREPDVTKLIVATYERLRHDERINDEPLFWLQYAIGMAEDGKLPTAQEFISAAYDRAARRVGFQTYQIDTQAFRIALLMRTAASPGLPVTTFPVLIEKLELLNTMLNEESHRGFAVKVLEHIHPFLARRVTDLTVPEKTSLTFWINTVNETLGQLSPDYRARSGSDQTRVILESAKRLLLK